ncbi:hypothetical protein Hdeb2414_s0004g00129691 [Helianthus debilis subsp. tardiflorus]
MDVAEVLRAGDKWLCGKCMVMHALSRGCKHNNEVVSFAMISGGVEDFIVGIGKPCQVVVDTNPLHPASVTPHENQTIGTYGACTRRSRSLWANGSFHFQNYGMVGIGEPMGIRVLSGVHFLEALAYLLPLCNEDTGPVMPILIFRGVTLLGLKYDGRGVT